jgi:hypothetical protein
MAVAMPHHLKRQRMEFQDWMQARLAPIAGAEGIYQQ